MRTENENKFIIILKQKVKNRPMFTFSLTSFNSQLDYPPIEMITRSASTQQWSTLGRMITRACSPFYFLSSARFSSRTRKSVDMTHTIRWGPWNKNKNIAFYTRRKTRWVTIRNGRVEARANPNNSTRDSFSPACQCEEKNTVFKSEICLCVFVYQTLLYS